MSKMSNLKKTIIIIIPLAVLSGFLFFFINNLQHSDDIELGKTFIISKGDSMSIKGEKGVIFTLNEAIDYGGCFPDGTCPELVDIRLDYTFKKDGEDFDHKNYYIIESESIAPDGSSANLLIKTREMGCDGPWDQYIYATPEVKIFSCWTQLAKDRNDLSLCHKLENKSDIEACYVSMALFRSDPSLCTGITNPSNYYSLPANYCEE